MKKRCARCRAFKTEGEFPRSRSTRDGLFSYCRKCANERSAAYHKANPEKHKANGKAWYDRNKQQLRDARKDPAKFRDHRRTVRRQVIEYYGGACACCGEREYEFLAIDHINNDGAEHRKVVACSNLPLWLRKNNFPKGFQVLCHNCNMAKGFYGECPHQKYKLVLVKAS